MFDHPTPGDLAERLDRELAGGAAPPADAELDRIATALARLPPGDPERSRIASRLRALVDQLTGQLAGQLARPAPAGEAMAARVEAADDAELFRLLDRTFAEAP